MITAEEVTWTYRILFGREPESQDVVAQYCTQPSLTAFVQKCLQSPEFMTRKFDLGSPPLYPLDQAPPIGVANPCCRNQTRPGCGTGLRGRGRRSETPIPTGRC